MPIKANHSIIKSEQSLITLYKSLVRPILTYVSSIWTLSYNYTINKLESIQYKFLRHLFYRCLHFSRFDYDFSVVSRHLNLYKIKSIYNHNNTLLAYRILRSGNCHLDLENLFVKRNT